MALALHSDRPQNPPKTPTHTPSANKGACGAYWGPIGGHFRGIWGGLLVHEPLCWPWGPAGGGFWRFSGTSGRTTSSHLGDSESLQKIPSIAPLFEKKGRPLRVCMVLQCLETAAVLYFLSRRATAAGSKPVFCRLCLQSFGNGPWAFFPRLGVLNWLRNHPRTPQNSPGQPPGIFPS